MTLKTVALYVCFYRTDLVKKHIPTVSVLLIYFCELGVVVQVGQDYTQKQIAMSQLPMDCNDR